MEHFNLLHFWQFHRGATQKPTVDKEEGSTMVISPPQKRSRMKFLKVYNKMYFCDILVIYVDIFSGYVKNRLHPEGLIWSVQTIREVHSRPVFWGLKWVPYSPSIVGEGVVGAHHPNYSGIPLIIVDDDGGYPSNYRWVNHHYSGIPIIRNHGGYSPQIMICISLMILDGWWKILSQNPCSKIREKKADLGVPERHFQRTSEASQISLYISGQMVV